MGEQRREVVAGAVVREGLLLVARRASPPELAGLWELPGGKAEPGEEPRAAVERELAEELAIVVVGGERVGPEVLIGERMVLRAYAAEWVSGEPVAIEHLEVAWIGSDALDDLPWVPSDRALIAALRELLRPRERA
ncbi:NUDIX domain-containing protein [Hoyosella sp. G463]|uniref:8-oxo-dGTP diphosphatase n=1 Tax=Lolliginicoccus lacisalsi TaxID=2742202 RepID=A0A927JBQ6_9ACTN|nr:NUDIX domain-containing protein [Lolliginicoccus lacisalsi]MBD8506264.1 NUDIX domain-containing protein [Lolliginicoccus lacisalsi]